MADTIGHIHGASAQLYQQALHYHMQSNPSPPTSTTRRVRPRATALESFMAAATATAAAQTSSNTGYATLATMNPAALNMNLSSSNGEGPSFRPPVAPSMGWGREAGYPVAPAAGETTPPQWWSTSVSSFLNLNPNVSQQNLNLNHAPGRLTTRRSAAGAEQMPPQGNPENGCPPPSSSSQRRSPSQ